MFDGWACMFMFICVVCMHIYMSVCTSMHVWAYRCLCDHVCVYMWVCISVWVCIHIWMSVCACMCECVDVWCLSTYVCMCDCVFIYGWVCVYRCVCTHACMCVCKHVGVCTHVALPEPVPKLYLVWFGISSFFASVYASLAGPWVPGDSSVSTCVSQ